MALPDRIKTIRSDLDQAMLRDMAFLFPRLDRLGRQYERKRFDKIFYRQLASIENRLKDSLETAGRRLENRPPVSCPSHLPITSKKDEIIETLKDNQAVIISGETGSGKSTQIPKMCLEAGRGIRGKIAVTQPRRIAAMTISRRIAEELNENLGQSVGYKIRFRDTTNPNGYIKVMTDGMLLAETQRDPGLYEYDTIMIDEAHERSLNIDFLLGILRKLLPERPELKLIITSATLETEKFSTAFHRAPVIEVKGRVYPVKTEYMPSLPEQEDGDDLSYVDLAVKAVDRLRKTRSPGDILIFMPTERDILETCDRLEGRSYAGTSILPLFARLPASGQEKIYRVSGHKIVVATNVAETSLTIPGIRYVIDTGLARISRYLPRTRTTSLPISPISQSSAEQRKGRCGRVQNGLCIRLYSQDDFENRPPFTPPEIVRANLAEVILRMIYLKLGDISAFPFIDPPNQRSIKDGLDLLKELGAISDTDNHFELTGRGRLMAGMPLDPRISRMIIEAGDQGCVGETAIIAAALSIQDPRERPLEKATQADQRHAPFKDPHSDFITLLNIWEGFHRARQRLKTRNQARKYCRENFLSYQRLREWMDIHDQIRAICKEQKIELGKSPKREISGALYEKIHKSILSGYLSNIARIKEKNIYQAAQGREVMVFPGSGLFNRSYSWIVVAEMVKTSRLFARTVARIDAGWLEGLGGGLCRYSYSGPHWSRSRGEVRAYEQVSLYGLIIVPERPVSYGSIDPEESHRIFIQSALVEGEIRESLSFLRHNRDLIDKITRMEDKVRRRGILVEQDVLADFYSRRLKGIHDVRSLKKLIKDKGGDDFLRLEEKDLIRSLPEKEELALFPDQISVRDRLFRISYKFAPGQEEDGMTVDIPSSAVRQLPAQRLDWPVPGLLREKITALLKGLPKRYRKELVPVSKTVDIVMEEMDRDAPSLISGLSQFIYQRFGVDIPARVWSAVEIPEYLKTRVSVRDAEGKELVSTRDLRTLEQGELAGQGLTESDPVWQKAAREWERQELTNWDFKDLPPGVPLRDGFSAYPALEAGEDSVNIRLFQDPVKAQTSHRTGVRRLFEILLAKDLKHLKRSLALKNDRAKGCLYFGGSERLEEDLYQALLNRYFLKDIRTGETFEKQARAARESLLREAGELKDQALIVIEAYREIRQALQAGERANPLNRPLKEFYKRLRSELDRLVPAGFIKTYDSAKLMQLPRYLGALKMRMERGSYDLEKDRKKMERIQAFSETLTSMIHDLSPQASSEKQQALNELRWMLEEFRVSVFAPELKTPCPVSAKRLAEKIKEIGRMV